MKSIALLLMLLSCPLAFATSEPTPIPDVAKYLDHQRDLREDFRYSKKFKHVDNENKERLYKAQDEVFMLLEGRKSVDELSPDQLIALYNAQGTINAVLTDAELDRLRSLTSNNKTWLSDLERAERLGQRAVHRLDAEPSEKEQLRGSERLRAEALTHLGTHAQRHELTLSADAQQAHQVARRLYCIYIVLIAQLGVDPEHLERLFQLLRQLRACRARRQRIGDDAAVGSRGDSGADQDDLRQRRRQRQDRRRDPTKRSRVRGARQRHRDEQRVRIARIEQHRRQLGHPAATADDLQQRPGGSARRQD